MAEWVPTGEQRADGLTRGESSPALIETRHGREQVDQVKESMFPLMAALWPAMQRVYVVCLVTLRY